MGNDFLHKKGPSYLKMRQNSKDKIVHKNQKCDNLFDDIDTYSK